MVNKITIFSIDSAHLSTDERIDFGSIQIGFHIRLANLSGYANIPSSKFFSIVREILLEESIGDNLAHRLLTTWKEKLKRSRCTISRRRW